MTLILQTAEQKITGKRKWYLDIISEIQVCAEAEQKIYCISYCVYYTVISCIVGQRRLTRFNICVVQ